MCVILVCFLVSDVYVDLVVHCAYPTRPVQSIVVPDARDACVTTVPETEGGELFFSSFKLTINFLVYQLLSSHISSASAAPHMRYTLQTLAYASGVVVPSATYASAASS